MIPMQVGKIVKETVASLKLKDNELNINMDNEDELAQKCSSELEPQPMSIDGDA